MLHTHPSTDVGHYVQSWHCDSQKWDPNNVRTTKTAYPRFSVTLNKQEHNHQNTLRQRSCRIGEKHAPPSPSRRTGLQKPYDQVSLLECQFTKWLQQQKTLWMNECYAQLGMTPALFSGGSGSKSQSRNQLSSVASCDLLQSHHANSTTALQIRPTTFPIKLHSTVHSGSTCK